MMADGVSIVGSVTMAAFALAGERWRWRVHHRATIGAPMVVDQGALPTAGGARAAATETILDLLDGIEAAAGPTVAP